MPKQHGQLSRGSKWQETKIAAVTKQHVHKKHVSKQLVGQISSTQKQLDHSFSLFLMGDTHMVCVLSRKEQFCFNLICFEITCITRNAIWRRHYPIRVSEVLLSISITHFGQKVLCIDIQTSSQMVCTTQVSQGVGSN